MGPCHIKASSILIILLLAFASSGCIEESEEDQGARKGSPPPFHEEFSVVSEECYMVGVGRWNANCSVLNTFLNRSLPVASSAVTTPALSVGDGSEGPAYTIVDADHDGLMTTGDTLLFFNLTEDLLIHHNISCDGEWVACFTIHWDDEDWRNYLVRASWVNESLEGDGTYSARITLWMREGDSGLYVDPWHMRPELRLGFISEHGTVLTFGKMSYNDTDLDRRVSGGDIITITGLSRDYHHCQVQFIHKNRLLGWTHLNLPGID